MKTGVVSFVSAIALASASIAMAGGMTSMAASSNQSSAAGVFVSGNLGYAKQDVKLTGGAPEKDTRGFAWNVNTGYQFNQYLALEAGYTRFSGIKIGINSANVDTHLQGVDLLAKGIYPINDQFNVFAKAGAMDMFRKTTATGLGTLFHQSRIVPEFGIGTSYNLTHHVALTLQGITTLAMKGPKNGSGTMPATYAGYAGVTYKF